MSFNRHPLIGTLLYFVMFVLTKAGQYPKCGKNELISPTTLRCEPTCTNDCSYAKKSKTYAYRPTCVCEPGYVRYNGMCINKLFCPKNRTVSANQYTPDRNPSSTISYMEVSNIKAPPLYRTRSAYLREPIVYEDPVILPVELSRSLDQPQGYIPCPPMKQGNKPAYTVPPKQYEHSTSIERPFLFEYQSNESPIINTIDSPWIYPSKNIGIDGSWIYPATVVTHYQESDPKCCHPEYCEHQEHSRKNNVPGYDFYCEHPSHANRPCFFTLKPCPVTCTTTKIPHETTTTIQPLSTSTTTTTAAKTTRTKKTTMSISTTTTTTMFTTAKTTTLATTSSTKVPITTTTTPTTTVSTSPLTTTTETTTTTAATTTIPTSTEVITITSTSTTTQSTTTPSTTTPSTTSPTTTTPSTTTPTTTTPSTTTTTPATSTKTTSSTTTTTPCTTTTSPSTILSSTTESCECRRKLSLCRPCCVPTCENDCSRARCANMCIAELTYVCVEGYVLHNGKCIHRDRCPPRARVSNRRPKCGDYSKCKFKPRAYPLESYEVRVKDFPFDDFEDVSAGLLYDYYNYYYEE